MRAVLRSVSVGRHRRVVAYARHSTVRWIADELRGERCDVFAASTMTEAITAMAQRRRVRPMLIVDFDPLSIAELADLKQFVANEWSGILVGLGEVHPVIREGLRVMHVVARPFGSETLRAFVGSACEGHDTVELEVTTPDRSTATVRYRGRLRGGRASGELVESG